MNNSEKPVTLYENSLTQQLQKIKSECFAGNGNKAKKEHLYRQRLRDFFQNEIIQFKNGRTEKTTTGQISNANVRPVIKKENAHDFLGRLNTITEKIQAEIGNSNFGNAIEKEVKNILENFMNWCEDLNHTSLRTSTQVRQILES